MVKILEKITDYRLQKGWSEYELSERSSIPQSTINSWYRRNFIPTIPTLEKICDAFGITLSQFFSEDDEPVALTGLQQQLLDACSRLDDEQLARLIAFIEVM